MFIVQLLLNNRKPLLISLSQSLSKADVLKYVVLLEKYLYFLEINGPSNQPLLIRSQQVRYKHHYRLFRQASKRLTPYIFTRIPPGRESAASARRAKNSGHPGCPSAQYFRHNFAGGPRSFPMCHWAILKRRARS